jgi:L-histidine N-alpha-methyltransferase
MSRAIATEVRTGLMRSPKSLPPRLLYDSEGTRLFEEITRLPEYYPTAVELSILQSNAGKIVASAGTPATLVELGVGSAYKTRVLLAALLAQRPEATFIPVDISRAALELTRRALAQSFPTLAIEAIEGPYELAFEALRARTERKLVLFIGSSIGNFEPNEALAFLGAVRAALAPGDALLLGTDLRKDPSLLRAAYDDSQGVTARFNLNLLERINRELGGHFDLRTFRHLVLIDEERSRVEMHLESLKAQEVAIDALGLRVPFAQGERIHTENSYKFTVPGVQRLLSSAGFHNERTWCDPAAWFAVHLARAVDQSR